MSKKKIISASSKKALKLKVLARKKENVRRRLAIKAEKLRLKAKRLIVTAKEKENVRRRLAVTAKKPRLKAKRLAITAKEKESVRRRLVVTAEKLAVTAKEKESIRRRLVITAEKLAVTAKEKESIRRRLVITAENLSLKAKQLAVTAKEKESVRRRLVITAQKLAVTAKERESVRRRLAVTAEKLAVTAKEKESIRRRLVVTAQKLAVTAKGRESVRRRLVVTAKKLAVTAKERESVRRRLVVTAQKLAVTAQGREEAKVATLNVLKDLSVEKSNLEKAKVKEDAILFSIGDGLIATDEKGKITLINKRAEELIGEKNGKALGKIYLEVIVVEDEKGALLPLDKRHINMALKQGITSTTSTATEGATYYYVRKNKTKFPVAFTVAPVILEGKIIGAIDVFRDITKEKEIDKAKSEFISLASHQLKTPPTAIKLLTERLLGDKMGTFTEKQKEYFEDIHSSNQRMIDLVNALLNVSRIELGAFNVKVNKKDVCAIVQSVLDDLKPVIDKKHLKLKTTYKDKNTMLMLDESLFRIVINNLVTNAIRYTAEEGEVQVDCKGVKKGQELGGKILPENYFVVVISDTGFGIPQKDYSKLFTKFFRADNARTKLPDGTGLGLYIVKSVLDHSGGLIWFTSRENEGSQFYIAIPMTGMRTKVGTKELT